MKERSPKGKSKAKAMNTDAKVTDAKKTEAKLRVTKKTNGVKKEDECRFWCEEEKWLWRRRGMVMEKKVRGGS